MPIHVQLEHVIEQFTTKHQYMFKENVVLSL
jgi:hypothetical protein